MALANNLGSNFIICDDKKLIRQIFFLNIKSLRNIKLLGFAFLPHSFYNKGLIDNIWTHFNNIIELCHWERSEVYVANYTFLKEQGY